MLDTPLRLRQPYQQPLRVDTKDEKDERDKEHGEEVAEDGDFICVVVGFWTHAILLISTSS
jgi:hypothetical protein